MDVRLTYIVQNAVNGPYWSQCCVWYVHCVAKMCFHASLYFSLLSSFCVQPSLAPTSQQQLHDWLCWIWFQIHPPLWRHSKLLGTRRIPCLRPSTTLHPWKLNPDFFPVQWKDTVFCHCQPHSAPLPTLPVSLEMYGSNSPQTAQPSAPLWPYALCRWSLLIHWESVCSPHYPERPDHLSPHFPMWSMCFALMS